MVSMSPRAWMHLPLFACACLGGCGRADSAASSVQVEMGAPARLQLTSAPKPLLAAPTAPVAQAAHSESPRILELSATPTLTSPASIREPAAAGAEQPAPEVAAAPAA